MNTKAFVEMVKASGRLLDSSERFGRYKVFIASLPIPKGMTEKEFRDALVTAHREGHLRLSRADLVPAMDQEMV